MADVEAISKAQRADGPTTVLATAIANPPNCVDQNTYPDYYFRVTNSDHMTRGGSSEKSKIKTRYLHLTEDLLKANPNIAVFQAPSLNARRDILVKEIPMLGAEAATKAIEEWGQPKSKITHVVFVSSGGADVPGADFHLINLLGLGSSVSRYMIYQQVCYGGAMALRLAKDLAENNKGARVLAVCCEVTVSLFHAPSSKHLDCLLGQAIFGDGAAAVIVGADPVIGVEKPLFQVVSARQSIIPETVECVGGHLREEGLAFHILKNVPDLVSDSIQGILEDTFHPLGISDWNSLFWMIHPGGSAIIDQIEQKLKLQPEKLLVTRQVLSEYGNMSSSAVLFVLDNMRKKSVEEGFKTTGEGLDWGVLFGFGPGLTVDTVVLRSLCTCPSTTFNKRQLAICPHLCL